MLSIGLMKHGQADYYDKLAREDYYLEGGEPPGQWWGRGAEALGLHGRVEREPFLRSFHGFHPFADLNLVQNAGDTNRTCGLDLTFSADKTVSVLASVLPEAEWKQVQEAFHESVKAALSYVEAECAFTRRGEMGRTSELARLVVAMFEHGTSRAQDPQLHLHALCLNVAVRPDGTPGTLDSRQLFRAKMAAGALFRAEFARRLEGLGYTIQRSGRTFEILGVPPEVVKVFSQRREEIKRALEERGLSTAKAAAIAALFTRTVKEHLPRQELIHRWRRTAVTHGFTPEEARRLRGPQPFRDVRREMADAVGRAVERLSEEVSHFSRRDLIRFTAEEAQGRGIGAVHVRVAVDHALQQGELVQLGVAKGEIRYTTRELLALEARLLSDVDTLHAQPRGRTPNEVLARAVSQAEHQETAKARRADPDAGPRRLSGEQLRALQHITQGAGSISVVSGMAGTGKSFLLSSARCVCEAQGRRVVGVALSGKAARGMDEAAGIQSRTIARLLIDLKAGRGAPLDATTVLVVDEAGMVGTRQMAALVGACKAARCELVLVGDRRQLQPIEVGGPFQAIERRIGRAELTEIIRQQPDKADPNPYWRRDAVRAFADGRAAEGLAEFIRRGRLHVADTREAAMRSLIAAWSAGGSSNAADHLILAATRHETRELNRMAQEARRAAGKLGHRQVRARGETFYEQDRIVITRNHYGFQVRNGDLGTVHRLDLARGRMTVRLDGGRDVVLPLAGFEHFELGYAVTTHKAQGATVRCAYVLCGNEAMTDRELTYVQASRAKQDTQFFAPRVLVWDRDARRMVDATAEELTREMSHTRLKDLAHDVRVDAANAGPALIPVR